MAAPLTASMPQFTQLGDFSSIDVEALDPTTGAPIDGVVVTNMDIWADVSSVDTSSMYPPEPGPFMLVSGPAA